MSSVTIVCPNAKRVQVKTSPMMLMRQVLEEACLKSGFEFNCHRLQTQSRKPVDASLPFRLAGIANNATLEMVQKESVSDDAVVDLAIQSASGARHQKKVGVNVPLFEVLQKFSSEFGEDLLAIVDGSIPCLVYMNKRYSGNAELAANSLSSLGISGGKCLVRHMRIRMNAEELAAIEAKQKEEADRKKAMDANFTKLKAENAERERLEQQRQKAFEDDKEARELREQEQLKALLPEEPQESMDTDAGNHQRDLLQEVPQQDANSWSFDGPAFSRPAPQTALRLEELNRLLERVDNSLASSSGAMESRMDAMVNALADGGRISLAEVRSKAEEVIKQQEEPVEVFANPCERNAVVFKKAARVQVEEPMETEEFFEVGVEDVKNMQKDLRKTVRDQTQTSFVSKAYLLKKNRQLKLEAYKHTVIRINIGEHVLQACFNTSESSSNLDLFLNGVFTNPGYKLLFTNMKVVTSALKNFVDLQLAPKSTMIASFGGMAVNAAEVLHNVREVTPEEADAISDSWLATNSLFIPFNSTTNDERKQKRPPISSSTSPSNSGPPAKSAMPKWMQTGRK